MSLDDRSAGAGGPLGGVREHSEQNVQFDLLLEGFDWDQGLDGAAGDEHARHSETESTDRVLDLRDAIPDEPPSDVDPIEPGEEPAALSSASPLAAEAPRVLEETTDGNWVWAPSEHPAAQVENPDEYAAQVVPASNREQAESPDEANVSESTGSADVTGLRDESPTPEDFWTRPLPEADVALREDAAIRQLRTGGSSDPGADVPDRPLDVDESCAPDTAPPDTDRPAVVALASTEAGSDPAGDQSGKQARHEGARRSRVGRKARTHEDDGVRSPLVVRAIKVIASAVVGVLCVFALLLVLLGIFARPGSDGISRIDGHPVLTVLSGSMRGVFNPGDMIIDNPISTANASRLAAGNIITFHVANTKSTNLITHRIVAVNHKDGQLTYQTKGDANNAPDPEPVTPQQIVGTYRQHIPLGGYLLQAIQKKTIFFILIAAPLIYLVVSEIAKHWNEPEKPDGEAAPNTDGAGADGDPANQDPHDAVSLAIEPAAATPRARRPVGSEGGDTQM